MAGRSDVILGVDFGTSHTVAALAGPDGHGRPMQFESSFLLPSAVFAESDGRLLVGKDAERSARLDPARFEPNPKRRVDDGVTLLGRREYQVPDVIAAVLRRVVDEAARVAGVMPAATVLTYPATWAASRKGVLAEAATRAGVPAVTLVPEPVAAAAYFTTALGYTVPPGGALVVYDFGGGTFDTSVLRRRVDGGWAILASDGLPDLGGVDLDGAIVEHISRTVGTADPARWQRLVHPDDDLARRRHLMLWADARAAKEQLSRSSSAAIHVPLFDVDTHLTREEFERVARPYLERTVDLTMATLQRAGVRPDQVAGLFTVGGSSRIPLAGTLLHHRLGVAPTLIEEPELAVALGSLHAVSSVASPAFAPAAGTTPPGAVPISPAAVPFPAEAPVSPPASVPEPPSAGRSAPVSAPASPAVDPSPAGVSPPAPRRRMRSVTVLAVAAVVVLAACIGMQADRFLNKRSAGASGDRSGQSGATGGTLQAPPGGLVQHATVNKVAWYAGLKLTFGEARYNAGDERQLAVDVRFENLGADAYHANFLTTAFRTGTDFYPGEVDIAAAVPAGQQSDGRIVFKIAKLAAPIASGAVVLGPGDRAQAVVPLGQGQLVAYEPRLIVKDKQVVNQDLVVRFTTCEIRADLVAKQDQAKKDFRAFSCVMDAHYTGSGSRYFGREMFRLRLPDGTTVGPTIEPLEVLAGAIVPGVYVAFTFKWPLPGPYVFQMINARPGEQATAANTTEIAFTVDP